MHSPQVLSATNELNPNEGLRGWSATGVRHRLNPTERTGRLGETNFTNAVQLTVKI